MDVMTRLRRRYDKDFLGRWQKKV